MKYGECKQAIAQVVRTELQDHIDDLSNAEFHEDEVIQVLEIAIASRVTFWISSHLGLEPD